MTIAGLATGHTSTMPNGDFSFLWADGFFFALFFSNGIKNERWWNGQMLADV